jgi:hypothetical protein
MPTARPRHVITETDEVARALDDAAKRWPADSNSRAKLLVHLVEEGHRVLGGRAQRAGDEHRDAIARTSGVLTGMYGDDYLRRLREDWPA